MWIIYIFSIGYYTEKYRSHVATDLEEGEYYEFIDVDLLGNLLMVSTFFSIYFFCFT